jgi:CheY-like chemotaxis protein
MANILIIDDDEEFRLTLSAMLETDGHRVSVARDGFEGANSYRAQRPDLVFVDMVMPHNGLTLIRVLRNQFSGLKVIAMSGGGAHRLAFARDLGVHRTLAKPFTAEQLATAIADTFACGSEQPQPQK